MIHINLSQGLDKGEAVRAYKAERQAKEEKWDADQRQSRRAFVLGFQQKKGRKKPEKTEEEINKEVVNNVMDALEIKRKVKI